MVTPKLREELGKTIKKVAGEYWLLERRDD